MPLICAIDQTENPDGSLFCSRCNAKLTRLRPGERFRDPRFVVGSRVREDAFSLAFLAENPESGKRYVLREFYRANAGNRELMRSFAQIAQSLESSSVVSMRTVSACTNAGRWYTVVESTEGTTLRSELDKSPMNAETTAKWFRAILAALREFHQASLYHGNLSSNVVMLRSDGRVDLVDSVFIGETLREGGPPALSSMVRKDIRDSGLLALEMLDGQSETGELGERLARVQDVALGATLEYVFSPGHNAPDSAAEVDGLIRVLKEAESAGDGQAFLLYTQAYRQFGSGRIKEVLDNIPKPPPPPPPPPTPPPPPPPGGYTQNK
jgi:serine/threonine protein kinase